MKATYIYMYCWLSKDNQYNIMLGVFYK